MRVLFVVAVVAMALLIGCATPEQKAQKLFDAGKYQEVLDKFGNLPIATQAKEKIAEGLFNEGKYDEVIANYGDTPYAGQARVKIAEKLLAEGKLDEVIANYGDTPVAMQAKDMKAKAEYEALMKEKDKKKVEAGKQKIMTDYAGTPTANMIKEEMDKKNAPKAPAKPAKPAAKPAGKKMEKK